MNSKEKPARPAWAKAMGMTPMEELRAHRHYREMLVKECGTDDVAVLSAKVKKVKTVYCTICGGAIECVEFGAGIVLNLGLGGHTCPKVNDWIRGTNSPT